jgi:ElaB/YqjD/DUF883 family membrane-anchored ribosome-binding protein
MFNKDDRKTDKETPLRIATDAVNDAAPEINEIGRDVTSLKAKTVDLAHNLRDAGVHKANEATAYVQDSLDSWKVAGNQAILRAEDRIKAKPGQSIAIAFVAGIVASFLLGRKSS